MRRIRSVGALLLAVATAFPLIPVAASAAPAEVEGPAVDYVVVLDEISPARGKQAVAAAGGTVVRENTAVGVMTVRATNVNFAPTVRSKPGVAAAARNQPVAKAPGPKKGDDIEKPADVQPGGPADINGRDRKKPQPGVPADEPLADLQWDMRAIGATSEGSYAVNRGNRGVRVGIIDTGVDANHPDIKPNFDVTLSRNFTTDMPDIDGDCEYEGCVDPATVDDNGHGTHVASTIGSPINGVGIAGVAPDVTLVNLRAGQDSGYFFIQPTVDALVYAADNGIDVVNMSYYVDPWWMNCLDNPADSPEAQAQQRMILLASQRALTYARNRGVTLVAAAGNDFVDMTKPLVDSSSPDYPEGVAYDRQIDPATCKDMPSQGEGVIAVSATGPSGRKAYYSSYGLGHVDVAAPGGDYRDFPGTPAYATAGNLILAAAPTNVLIAEGRIDPETGEPTDNRIVKDCTGGTCAYWQYLQGTSMAAPHATGVVALIVARWGHPEPKKGGLTLAPKHAEQLLYGSSVPTACPATNPYVYPGLNPVYTATCEGTPAYNGFFGRGGVNALHAVTNRRNQRPAA